MTTKTKPAVGPVQRRILYAAMKSGGVIDWDRALSVSRAKKLDDAKRAIETMIRRGLLSRGAGGHLYSTSEGDRWYALDRGTQ